MSWGVLFVGNSGYMQHDFSSNREPYVSAVKSTQAKKKPEPLTKPKNPITPKSGMDSQLPRKEGQSSMQPSHKYRGGSGVTKEVECLFLRALNDAHAVVTGRSLWSYKSIMWPRLATSGGSRALSCPNKEFPNLLM